MSRPRGPLGAPSPRGPSDGRAPGSATPSVAAGAPGPDNTGARPGTTRERLLARLPGRRLLAYAAIAGPGLIAANAGNDAAGIATYASAGSQFVYGTLFFMVLVTVALVLVQEMAVRLGTYTGKGLAALIREQFSLRLTGVALFSVLLANTGLVVAEFAGIGAAFELVGVTRYLVIPLSAVVIWSLVVFGSYRYAERIFLIMSLAFFAYPVAMIMGHPRWGEVAANLVLPHFQLDKDYLLLGVALIGTTVSPYMQLYAAAGVVDRGASPADYRNVRLDAIAGALFACLISITIIIATGSAIGGQGPLESAKQAAEALRPVAGSGAELLFALGLLGASALAGAVVPLSSAYAISEAVGVERSVSRRFREAPLFLGLFSFQVFLGAAIAMTPVNLIKLLIGTQVLQGIVAPIVLVYILILANRTDLLGAAANGPVRRVLATLAVGGVAAMSLLLLGQTLLGFVGLG